MRQKVGSVAGSVDGAAAGDEMQAQNIRDAMKE